MRCPKCGSKNIKLQIIDKGFEISHFIGPLDKSEPEEVLKCADCGYVFE